MHSASAYLAMQSAVLAIEKSVLPSVTRWHCVDTTLVTIMESSLDIAP